MIFARSVRREHRFLQGAFSVAAVYLSNTVLFDRADPSGLQKIKGGNRGETCCMFLSVGESYLKVGLTTKGGDTHTGLGEDGGELRTRSKEELTE